MSALQRLKFWRRDEGGAAAVEFALVLTPLLIILLGALEFGYVAYVKSLAQGALNNAARLAAVEDPVLDSEGDTVEEQVANYITSTVGLVAVDEVVITSQSSYSDFSDIGNPEKLMTDKNGNGEYDASDGDCFEDMNGNGSYDTDAGGEGIGGASDVAFYQASIAMPRLLPIYNFIAVSNTTNFTVKTAVRNQPYALQATPAVICGDD
jgi:Flp pilus assembly pilin Flp